MQKAFKQELRSNALNWVQDLILPSRLRDKTPHRPIQIESRCGAKIVHILVGPPPFFALTYGFAIIPLLPRAVWESCPTPDFMSLISTYLVRTYSNSSASVVPCPPLPAQSSARRRSLLLARASAVLCLQASVFASPSSSVHT